VKSVLVTGGSGFFGGLLKDQLLRDGRRVVNIDLERDELKHPNLISIRGDIRNRALVNSIFEEHAFETVYHCAAILAHAAKDAELLWSSNVEGTRIVAEGAKRVGTRNFVFISSNCLWGKGMKKAVHEDEPPCPVEIYGRSKWEAEKALDDYADDFNVTKIRCPTIVDQGRLGLLTILFDFIREGRKVWVVGRGSNRYQFIAAQDLIGACLKAAEIGASDTFNIGSDDVKSLREVFQFVIDRAKTGARIKGTPKLPMLMGMRLAHALGLSPLGPYQYKMIAEDFVFSTDKIKALLGWKPSVTNEQMLWSAYEFYSSNYDEIRGRRDVSAHRQPAKMGIIRLLKWMS
jgi:UDP-glucose 4-epimerase